MTAGDPGLVLDLALSFLSMLSIPPNSSRDLLVERQLVPGHGRILANDRKKVNCGAHAAHVSSSAKSIFASNSDFLAALREVLGLCPLPDIGPRAWVPGDRCLVGTNKFEPGRVVSKTGRSITVKSDVTGIVAVHCMDVVYRLDEVD